MTQQSVNPPQVVVMDWQEIPVETWPAILFGELNLPDHVTKLVMVSQVSGKPRASIENSFSIY